MKLLDAHNHMQSAVSVPCEDNDIVCICNGTSISDWKKVAGISRKFPSSVIPYFGVHPWFAGNLPGDWETGLRKMLGAFPGGVGEIGLDRSSRKVDMDVQKRVFLKQLETASEMKLPAAIHCVRAWGIMTEILEDVYRHSSLPFMLHSFSGSVETMEKLAAAGGYFSFSPGLLDRNNVKLRKVFEVVPLDRILLETDFPASGDIADKKGYRNVLYELYAEGSAARKLSLTEFIGVIVANGEIFTNRASSGQQQHGEA